MKIARLSLIAAIGLGSLLACTTIATAQESNAPGSTAPGKKRGASAQQRVDRMSDELKLNDTQKTKVKALFEEQGKKMREMRDDTSLTREQRREKMQAMQEETNKKMKEILTPEQFDKWQKMREQMRKNRPEGGKKRQNNAQ